MKTTEKFFWSLVIAAAIAWLAACLSGCATLDRAYQREVTWTNAAVVRVFTNTVTLTNLVPVVVERTNVIQVTNAATGTVSTETVREPIQTNRLAVVETNYIPVYQTNQVLIPVTNLVASPKAEATIQATGSVINTFAPGVGSIVALALGGLYHGYRQTRNRKINEALIQGVETARAVLTTTPQGQAADAQFVKWLMTHQKESGVFTTITTLVDQLTDNPAAKLTAQEISERLRQAEQSSVVAKA